MLEFHISKRARDYYEFDQSIFSTDGNVIFANFLAARQFAEKINKKKNLLEFPEQAISAGQINALGLIDEIFHFVFHQYLKENEPLLINNLFDYLEEQIGKENLNSSMSIFIDKFPPTSIYQKLTNRSEYLNGASSGIPNKHLIIEEMLMLWLTNVNPAITPYIELFDDTLLQRETKYREIISKIQFYFSKTKFFGPDNQDIVSMLRTPAIEVPHSLSGQLEFIRKKWGGLIGKYLYKLLGSLDLIKEEQRMIFAGPGPTVVPDMHSIFESQEFESYSPDSDWMPKVVMLAKNTYVWLSQLSKQYNRSIIHLNDIPDETLDELARWGFNGLWLIGLWERSESSKRIKQLCGNPDAVASAYSLSRYEIASDLGGESAYQNLRDRAEKRGIRLASDMVPNHMGIDSNWVYEHPEWFITADQSPFPSYSFNSIDLSLRSDISINLEDHYYDRTDAAVVFKRYNHHTGETKFVYHGNDGTSMPWNDTAQLNYLNPEVREAVIQTILSVARRFPIIRFDAAMTLTKKHYQRLWFPQPGSGGDIPSRADFSMSKQSFDQAMPEEFWREVVNRVSQEVPDTLLLAEAFWLMEGFFVRTLGMHRVYNSAFMNMLRNEENDKYRLLIKNTLTFDPQILKRYVNFMNNPDEKTAVEQFGKGDKYFGICTLMATMPGLPMFGHGQIEGFAEKYGMEYYRPYWDEYPDQYLISRHEREIFPILYQRSNFANVENFLLYDFQTSSGIDENVFAYSNGAHEKRSLIVYNNKFSATSGWIKRSVDYLSKSENRITYTDLYSGLNLKGSENSFVIFSDITNHLEYIRNAQEIREKGLFFELDAYKTYVFLNIREVYDTDDGKYYRLNQYLNGRGVPSVEEALKELTLSHILNPLRELLNPMSLLELANIKETKSSQRLIDGFIERFNNVIAEVDQHYQRDQKRGIISETSSTLESILDFSQRIKGEQKNSTLSKQIDRFILKGISEISKKQVLLIWCFLRQLGGSSLDNDSAELSRSWFDELGINKIIENTLYELDFNHEEAYQATQLLRICIGEQLWFSEIDKDRNSMLENWLGDESIRSFLQMNRYQGILYYNKERFDDFLWWIFITGYFAQANQNKLSVNLKLEKTFKAFKWIQDLQKSDKKAEYQVEKLLNFFG